MSNSTGRSGASQVTAGTFGLSTTSSAEADHEMGGIPPQLTLPSIPSTPTLCDSMGSWQAVTPGQSSETAGLTSGTDGLPQNFWLYILIAIMVLLGAWKIKDLVGQAFQTIRGL